jgi:serine/threonine-protein kinase
MQEDASTSKLESSSKAESSRGMRQLPKGPLSIHPDCWMIGHRNPHALLQCNTYLRTFSHGSQSFHVCVDPGSQIDYPVIETNLQQLIGGVDQLHAMSLNHQDPDVVGNAPALCAANPQAALLVTEDVWRLAQHLRFQPGSIQFANPARSEMTVLGERDRWQLVPTPFCHFRGAMAFYDPELRTLFSGDLFGGLNRLGRVHLFAEESDWSGIAQFHQIYMPTREALRYAIRQIQALDPPVQWIAPQHGYVIGGELVGLFMERMYDLQVGHDLLAIELDETYFEAYRDVVNQVLNRATELLGPEKVISRLREAGSDGLECYLRMEGDEFCLQREGYTAVVKVLGRLSDHEALEVGNLLRNEVLGACAELGIPIPPVGAGLADFA